MTVAVSLLAAVLAAGAPRPQATPVLRFDDSRLARLPARIVRDLAHLATPLPLEVLAAGAAAAGAVHAADRRVGVALPTSPSAERALDGGAVLGGGAIQFGLAGAVYGAGLASHREGVAGLGSALLEAQVVEGVTTQALKYAVNRRRPDGGRYSFPSGHTSSAFATADVLLQHFGWRAGLAAYAAAAYVGTSRISERQHYLSDVVFGAAVGIASARTPPRHAGPHTLRIAPVVLRGGGAVEVSLSR